MRDDHQGYGSRTQMKKRKTKNNFLNISIAIVGVLIFMVGAKILFGFGGKEEVAVEMPREEEMIEDIEDSQLGSEEELAEENETPTNVVRENNEKEEEKTVNEKRQEPSQSNQNPTVSTPRPTIPGQWQPIGTVQPEPFTAVYDKDHVNWEEMTRAFQYATGLNDDMVIWWVRNGGNHESAIGTVSTKGEKTTPYEVRIEWVPNQGWKPVSVVKLDNNQYISSSSIDNDDENSNENN